MRQTIRLFMMGLRQMVSDGMLLMLLPAPFLIAIVIKVGLPCANQISWQSFGFSIEPWYGIADAFLLTLSPLMVAMACAFLLLDERDEGTGLYYQITPVQGYAYLMARIGLPMTWSFVCNIVVGGFFSLANPNFQSVIIGSLIGVGASIACAMMIVTLAQNRVEGLAISKLTGVSLFGIFAVWFVPKPYQYLCAFLPSFWVGELMHKGLNMLIIIGGLFSCILWIVVFTKGFFRKI